MVCFRRLAVVVLVGACGTTDDNRPLDAEYVTAAVLAPTCGAAQCHSTWEQHKGDVFDTLVGMRRSIVDNGLVSLDSLQFDPADPASSALITWVTKTDPLGLGIGRMPFDAPMPNEDIHFLEHWIVGEPVIQDDKTPCSKTLACPPDDVCRYANPTDTTGNCVNVSYDKPGAIGPARGAQCDPGLNGGISCLGRERRTCKSDWNFASDILETCASDCSAGVCL
jgi:hypothetical protein